MMEEKIFKSISRKDIVVEDIVDQLSRAILNGHFQPGDKLIELRLAEQFGVSRVPIREALSILEQIGLVEKTPYLGTFVSQLGEQEIIELHSLRRVLEGMAVRLLAERNRPEDLAYLLDITEQMREVVLGGNRSEILLLDADFHDALIKLTKHHLLIDIWEKVSIKMRRFLLLKRHHTHRTIQDVIAPHIQIVDAIRTGDPVLAEKELSAHLSQVEDSFMQAIKKGEKLTQYQKNSSL
jgi:DNA-binding GntR family transcriptional regulator